jgi:uncharacterized protein
VARLRTTPTGEAACSARGDADLGSRLGRMAHSAYGPFGFVVPLVLAFFYSWLYNRTQSVLLCIVLHASFTAAQDHLLLVADSRVVDAVLLSTYIVGAAVVIAITRGRLGYRDPVAELR